MKKIAVIGATGSARKRTAPALRDSDEFKISAIQGRNAQKLEGMCREYDIDGYYLSAKEMLDNAEYDIIYIANPPFMHFDDIKMCFAYEKPIICEKPMCLSSYQSYEIAEISKHKNIPIMIAHQMRHQRAYDFIKNYIESGKLGKISFVYAKWDYLLDSKKPSSLWKCDYEKSGGGVMNDVGIHLLDFIVGLFGKPIRVEGKGEIGSLGNIYSTETALCVYNGFSCVVECSFERENINNEFMILGTRSCIRIPNGMGEKSIKCIHIDDLTGRKTVYFSDENLYKNEVEDFGKYLDGDASFKHRITTAEDALLCEQIIQVCRCGSNN